MKEAVDTRKKATTHSIKYTNSWETCTTSKAH